MTGKATTDDIRDEGFQAQNFGTLSPADWATYVQLQLDRASVWAQQRVTAINYVASTAGNYAFDALVRAEVAYVVQVLWKRRMAFIDSGANLNLQDDKRAQAMQQALKNADDANADMIYWIGEAQRVYGIDPSVDQGGTGISTGYIETGRFPQTSSAPLNPEQTANAGAYAP